MKQRAMIGRNSVTEQNRTRLSGFRQVLRKISRAAQPCGVLTQHFGGRQDLLHPAAGGGGSAPGGGLIASAAEDARATTVCPIRVTPRWRSRAVIRSSSTISRSSSTIRMFATRSPYPLCVTATSQFVSPDHCNTKIIGHGTALTQGARPNTLTPAGWRTVLGA
jgi:hypothetical protein